MHRQRHGMAESPRILHRPLTLLALLLVALVGALAAAPVAQACTFEVPIEEETGEDLKGGPGDEVIEIPLGMKRARTVTVWSGCGDTAKKKRSNPNPGFGVFPGSGNVPRRVFDERRGQAGRDAEQLAASRKTKPGKRKSTR